ncbi:hypothetical protein Poly24_22100 [Rosistilla carotiformis]|uniref:Large cysteine-rich periplasmic protein OmcB n=1 Tax=Rosistilla carotiformis TaxID=2528017 RepID=A0A518JSH5_9BACT|nr:hypothetical protein [Rosistilla carotiformis]QDV68501.1 hypothetical protein Poly24_22100 [Rosistilla carotiformis]
MTNYRLFAWTVTLVLVSVAPVVAQSQGFNQELKLRPDVKPAFHVTPMSHKFEATRGKRIPVKFDIESVERPTVLHVQTVSLRQESDGTILPDTESPAPDNLELLSPADIQLAENELSTIECRLRVPSNSGNFHSFGLLVTDLGRIVEQRPIAAGDNKTRRVGVRFVTRYLLRVDVTVTGARGEDAANIDIESVELIEDDGFAKARVWITNSTESPLEFQAQAGFVRAGSTAGKNRFSLSMPNRQSVESDERYNVRILPGARLRLEHRLPEAAFPGEHEMEVSLITNRRTRKKQVFPVTIRAGEFPAQDALLIQAARDITVAPSQVELSMRRGGNRRVAVEIKNNSPQDVTVDIQPQSGSAFVDGLIVRPTELKVRAGSHRKFLATLDAHNSDDLNRYTHLNVIVTSDAGEIVGEFSIPVALLARTEQTPLVQWDPLQWDGSTEPPAFVLPVRNTGQMHLPLQGNLKMVDAFGRAVEMQAGYGRWLLPGEEFLLRFRTKFAPPAGKYRYQIKIDGDDSTPPIEIEDELQMGPELPESAREAPEPATAS